jgi:hypothetical protein
MGKYANKRIVFSMVIHSTTIRGLASNGGIGGWILGIVWRRALGYNGSS